MGLQLKFSKGPGTSLAFVSICNIAVADTKTPLNHTRSMVGEGEGKGKGGCQENTVDIQKNATL